MIEGMDMLLKKIGKIGNVSMVQPVNEAIIYVQGRAKENVSTDTGELRESIFCTTQRNKPDNVTGICYTNKEYAGYVEFGTGKKGQEQHSGISPDIAVAYRQSPWWIHESQIAGGRETAERYHWFYIDTPEGRFYQCTGQPARPFMYPALHDHKESIQEIIEDAVRRQLE